jgi:hypothetical protein
MTPEKPKTRGVVVRLDAEDHRRLKHLAADSDCTLLELARRWIREGIAQGERSSKGDSAEIAGREVT